MRILWHSNSPLVGTGYGSQTRLFTPRIKGLGHEVAISCYWGINGFTTAWQGIALFPGDEQWGNRLLPQLASHWDADVVISLMDVWVLNPNVMKGLPLACWVPVDHEPAPRKVIKFFEMSGARPIAMSQFGERMLQDAGLDPLYVPHGVDTRVFRPRDTREQTREGMNIPKDAFVVGMVAANQGTAPPRKAFPQVFEAFKRFAAVHDDAYLYLHCDPISPKGVNLGHMAEAIGIDDSRIRYTNPLQLELGIPDDHMADLYSAFDVLACPSYGEGFGIPIIEAQACGVPVIVNDCTAMSELCGAGWMTDGDPWFDPGQRANFTIPHVASILDCMLEAYKMRDSKTLADAARKFALDYDVGIITRDHWRPVLNQLRDAPILKVAA